MEAGNVTEAYNMACELADWLDRGGFPPVNDGYLADLKLLGVPGYDN
jgi:hypothetical protein